jgi:membrane-associated phospholipid phosphatase
MTDFRSASTLAPSVRLRLHLGPKVGVLLGLALGICIPYFGLQRVDGLPLRSVPVTALDRIIPFEPAWIWVYVSLALLVPLAPLLSSRRAELARYARGLAMLCVPCFLVFLLFPVGGPRPGALPDTALYRWIVGVDGPSNSMPSLHAGLTLYSLLHLARVLPAARPRWITAAGWAWGALILYSTLATRQHWVVDLPAGMGIAWIAHAIAWRAAPSERTDEGVALAARG